MALTPSTMMPLGTPAPNFSLPEPLTGNMISLADARGEKATVVMFICNHCPFVKHVNPELVRLGHDYLEKGVGFVAISSNDAEHYPDDAPGKMAEVAKSVGYPFPYLYDETQEVAKAYNAACTPDFYIFDATMTCAYRGQLDDSRPGNDKALDGSDIRNALDALLAGKMISGEQKPSAGCNIKWKK